MQLTRERPTFKLDLKLAEYTLEGIILQNVDKIKHLRVTIIEDLRWNTHVSNFCIKANRTPGFLGRNLYPCLQDVNEAVYKGLVRPLLGLVFVFDLHGVILQEELESVQKHTARFVTGNYNYILYT